MTPNNVRIYSITQWEEFVPLLSRQIAAFNLFDRGTGTIFRGQASATWPLSSPLERSIYGSVPVGGVYPVQRDVDREKRIIEHFKKLIVGAPGTPTDKLSDHELEALGRHYGLCTALLDWTRSPYVAAYFAFMDAIELANPGIRSGVFKGLVTLPSDPVVIWGLTLADRVTMGNDIIVDEWRKDEFYRQRAQQGLFTRLTNAIFVDIASYLSHIGLAHYLCRIDIPGSEAAKAILDLDTMNINEASLFPDSHGAAIRANLQLHWAALEKLGIRKQMGRLD